MKNYLEFEKEIKALEQEVDGLKSPFGVEGISEVDTKKIKNTNELLSDNEVLKNTLNIRNAYLDPLSLIQITLMQKMKNSTLADEEKKALLLSINGLAAGLRNTG